MNQTMRTVLFLFFMATLAGCNQSGMNLGGGSSSGLDSSSSSISALSAFASEDGSGDLSGSLNAGDGSAIQVARVHNPEPASMLLLGIGLAGAALSKKRRA